MRFAEIRKIIHVNIHCHIYVVCNDNGCIYMHSDNIEECIAQYNLQNYQIVGIRPFKKDALIIEIVG